MFCNLFSTSDNQCKYHPNSYARDTDKSIVTPDGRYDFTRFSAYEESVIKQVLINSRKKYPPIYQAIGLANESEVIVYKPRYVLFEIITIKYQDSVNPLDMATVSFAYQSKGAHYRKEALRYYEAAKDNLNLSELNEFSCISVLSFMSKIADVYEREHEYQKAIECFQIIVRTNEGNTEYFRQRIEDLRIKKITPVRRRKISQRQTELEEQVHLSAIKYMSLFYE